MKNTTIIQISLSWLIILSVVAVHACTLTCSVGIFSCVSDLNGNKAGGSHSCCTDKNTQDKDSNNCQKEHLAFFQTFGKSPVTKTDQVVKIFPPLVAELLLFFNELSAQNSHCSLDYVIFHPPPPSCGIQILISSFLI